MCAEGSAAIVCVAAAPDRAVTLTLGGTELVPGECVRAPTADASGSLPVRVRDGRGRTTIDRIRIRRAQLHTVELSSAGVVAVRSATRCDGRVP